MASLRSVLLAFLRTLLVPVAGVCLRRGVKVQDAIEALKGAFVEAARRELEQDGREQSVSRISVMTGLHRRDVTRLTSPDAAPKETLDLLTRVIGQWRHDRRFSTRGKPKALSVEGTGNEFTQLVQSVSKDLNAYTVLFELERLGALERKGGRASLKAEVFVPGANVEHSLSLLSGDTADFLLAVEENIFDRQDSPNLHVKTYYDNVCPEFLPEIREWFLERGAELHERARAFLAKFDKDLNPKLRDRKGGARVVLGTFSRTEAPEEKD